MPNRFTRRYFLKATAGAAVVSTAPAIVRGLNLNEKLSIAAIGCGGKGISDIEGVSGLDPAKQAAAENLVALCDVDANTLGKMAQRFAGAKTYSDFRKMLETQKDIEAVTVSVPDHIHGVATMMALKLGKHVYTQKPLTRTIWEARKLTEEARARRDKQATAMGNQGHSGEGWRLLCEYVWSGTIGKVTEAYSWTNRPSGFWLQGADRPPGTDPVPANLKWDLWVGPAPMRPYVSNYPSDVLPEFRRRTVYHPFSWRGWWDFGCGALGDMGCHVMDGANWALKFGAADTIKVEVVKSAALHKESAPLWSTLRYHFPARAGMPAMTYTWYDGGNKHNPPPRPPELDEGLSLPESGTVFKGEKATILADTYGGSVRIIPEAKRKVTPRPPATLARTKGHYAEFVAACRDPKNQPSGSFDYAGPFTEIVLLGNLALRAASAGAAGPIEWDVKAMKVTNNDAANQFVKPEFRAGYEM